MPTIGILGGLLIVLVSAALCAFALQYSTRGEGDTLVQIMGTTALLDILVITVVMVFVWSLLGRVWWSVGLVMGLVLLIAAANQNKVELRREPVFPSDLDFISEAGFLFSVVGLGTALAILFGVLAFIAVTALIGWVTGRWFPRPRLRRRGGGLNKKVLVTRVVAFVFTGGLLVHAWNFNEPPNLWRSMYDAAGPGWSTSSQLWNYRTNGFLGGFLYNTPVQAIETPENYDAETMDELTERYEERADEINVDREGSLEDTNVVFILSESFTDPSWMGGMELDTNPIPATQDVMSETLAGQMYASTYGGGTSTMEFESLTGQPVGLFRPQVTSPYQMFVSDYDAYPSAVGAFSELGHDTVALHAYNLHMYKRSAVYQTLGFDEVINDEAMQNQTHLEQSPYISDQAAFDEVLYQMDNRENPMFLNLVTMQNHGPFLDFYQDPIGSDIEDQSRADEIGQYARGLAYSDEAMTEFMEQLQDRDEETILVFYGDHHPGVYNEEILDNGDPDDNMRTPYFVWSSETNESVQGGAITPAMLLPALYEVADAPVSPYIALLDDVRGSLPVLQHGRTLDPQGQPVDLEDLDAETESLLEDLTLVQYDFSIGERYSVDTMWPGSADHGG